MKLKSSYLLVALIAPVAIIGGCATGASESSESIPAAAERVDAATAPCKDLFAGTMVLDQQGLDLYAAASGFAKSGGAGNLAEFQEARDRYMAGSLRASKQYLACSGTLPVNQPGAPGPCLQAALDYKPIKAATGEINSTAGALVLAATAEKSDSKAIANLEASREALDAAYSAWAVQVVKCDPKTALGRN